MIIAPIKSARPTFRLSPWLLITLALFVPSVANAQNNSLDKAIRQFSNSMQTQYKYNAKQVIKLLRQAKKKPSILKAIDRQAEAKPWHIYRKLFIDKQRIAKGVQFWNKHELTLRKAEKIYGVDPEIVLGIIGVETRFGTHKGNYRILDALYTLGFYYPRRGKYFRKELAQFLVMTKEEGLDPLKIKGSFAGAMGWPQFMPSSYRRFSVDFDQNGKRDLLNSVEDAIGSVAHYLKNHGWQKGQDIAVPVKVHGSRYKKVLKWGIKPKKSVSVLKRHGIRPLATANNDLLAALFDLKQKKGKDYWLGLKNFYVITRYNRSTHYAMAVTQLGQEVRQKRAQLLSMQNKTKAKTKTKSKNRALKNPR